MRKKLILFFLFAVYLTYHLATLPISPFPWFDETVFASMTHTYLDSSLFQAKISMIMNNGKEVVEYGPLYFWLTSLSVKIFGFGIFQFRIIGLLFGFMMLFVFYSLLSDKANKIFFLFLFSLDTLLHSSMHGGRMDTMAVSFVMLSICFFLKSSNDKFYQNIFLSGLFAAAAMLTTPRSGIFFIPVGVLFSYRFFCWSHKKYLIGALIWLVTIIILYAPWYFYAFDSFNDFLNCYTHATDMVKVAFFIPKYQYPLIIVSVIFMLHGFFTGRKKYFTEINIILLLNIFLFYSFLHDTGTYSIFIVPFYYLLIANELNSSEISFKNWKMILVLLLFVFNVGVFSVKSWMIFSDMHQRQPAIADKFINTNIPPGKSVIGDEIYYYSVIKSGSDFQYINQYGSDNEREKYQREKYDYDYIVWSDRLEEKYPYLLKLYANNVKLIKVGSITAPSFKLYYSSKLVGINVSRSYNGAIYKRIK